MGTGNRVAAEINAGQYSKVFQPVAHRPVHHDRRRLAHGQLRPSAASPSSRSIVGLRDRDRHAGGDYGWPYLRVPVAQARLAAQRSDLLTRPERSAREAVEWVQNNGNPYVESANYGMPPISFDFYGTKFDHVLAFRRLGFDSRNRGIFADVARATA